MLRKAEPGDEAGLERFLSKYPDTSMFLRGNLATHGLRSDAPHGTTYVMSGSANGIRAVFGITNSGFMMCQNPELDANLATEFADCAAKSRIKGITGCARQVPQILAALNYPHQAWSLARDEPLMSIDLNSLPANDDVHNLRSPTAKDTDFLMDWFRNHDLDTGLSTAEGPVDKHAQERAVRTLSSTSFCILEENGVPVAMSNFNAELPDIVQVGGVYVPRELRNRGLGRRIVAAQLARARANGVKRAVLFAANEPAARAYRAIGFRDIGSYRVNLISDDWSPE